VLLGLKTPGALLYFRGECLSQENSCEKQEKKKKELKRCFIS
jgi:hypothetical protein